MTMVISTSPANRYLSWKNCLYCLTLLKGKPKLTESTSNVRKKRQTGHCIFRHCSGLVCAQKLLRRRKNKQHCVCLRISQDTINHYWKLHDKSDEKESGEKSTTQPCPCEEKIDSNEPSGDVEAKEEQGNDIECARDCAGLATHCKREDTELNMTLTFPSTSTVKPYNDHNVADPKCKQLRNVKHTNALRNVCNDSRKVYPKTVDDNACGVTRRSNSLNNVNSSRKSSERKCSQSETSFCEALAADNRVSLVMYDKLQKKCGPSVKTKLSKDRMHIHRNLRTKFSPHTNTDNEKCFVQRQRFNAGPTVDHFMNDVRNFSLSQNHRYSTRQLLNKYRLAARLQNGTTGNAATLQKNVTPPLNWQTRAAYQRKQPKTLCKNCCHHAKVQNCSELLCNCPKKQSLPVSQHYYQPRPEYKMLQRNLQSRKASYPCECYKSQKQLGVTTSHNFCFLQKTLSKRRTQMPQEKPTFVIFRNNNTNQLYSTTNSPNSTSSASARVIRRSAYDDQMNHRCSHTRTSYCTRPMAEPCKYNTYNALIDSTSLLSPTTSLPSSRQCRSWTVLSQNSVYRQQEPISSSSCVNVERWKKLYDRNENRTAAYLSSTSSSCSLSSLSTFREDYSLEDTDKDLKHTQRAWRRPRYRDQKRKRISFIDEHRVRWNIRGMY